MKHKESLISVFVDWNMSKGTLEWSDLRRTRDLGYPLRTLTSPTKPFWNESIQMTEWRCKKAVDDALEDRFPYSAEFRIVLSNAQIKFCSCVWRGNFS